MLGGHGVHGNVLESVQLLLVDGTATASLQDKVIFNGATLLNHLNTKSYNDIIQRVQ